MESYIEEEEDRFFDACEEICSLSDSVSDCSEESSSNDRFDLVNDFLDSLRYKVWCKSPESVNERRRRFRRCLGLGLEQDSNIKEDEGDSSSDKIQLGIDRITQDSGAVLRTSNLEHEFFSSESLVSTWANDAKEPRENHDSDDSIGHAVNNLGGGMEFVMDERACDGILNCSQGAFSIQSVSSEELNKITLLSSSLDKQLLHREVKYEKPLVVPKKVKQSWLRKLGFMAHLVDRHGEDVVKTSDNESTSRARMKRPRVHTYSKRSKELSSLYPGQEFVAHDGPILTMKFSLDGQYLASAGKDCIVRVWKVVEDERIDSFDTQGNDPSCLYFKMNHLSQLVPLNVGQGKMDKMPRPWIPAESNCVIFPPKVFQILEKPAHEFHGHTGEILDLSWSTRKFLLSSSVDKTVRLWRVGHDRCLSVFSHNNYVTSVAFNPVDDNYFISGSIDGKVRIWEVPHCKVIDYTDVGDIVTAVSYRPDGKGGLVGSMIGNCRFYEIIDNQLRLKDEICLQGKKKLSGKRITGFQFSTTDPSKVIVTSADSLVRVLSGVDVICKFKASGFRIAASQMFATFTQDGKHIISASEDSNVYIWNYTNQDKNSSRPKKIWSSESFLSHNVSVALPWCGIETTPGSLPSPTLSQNVQRNSLKNEQEHQNPMEDLEQKMPHSSPDCFSLTRHLLESLMKGPVTWPEEALPNSSPAKVTPALCKSKLKILKNACQSMVSSPHMWGLAIVTATFDGKIRTYYNYGLPIRL